MAANCRMLVAVDVDGTLLNTEFDDVLGHREIAALESVRAAGHRVALCTGRNLPSVTNLLERSAWFPDDLPLVLLNGAVVWGDEPRRELVANELTGADIVRLVELFREFDTVPMIYGADRDGGLLYHERRAVNDVLGGYLDIRRRRVGRSRAVHDLTTLGLVRALEVGTIDRRERITALTAAVQHELADRVRVINTRSLLGGGAYYWAEVFHHQSGKGRGLSVLAENEGIALDCCIAIGDNYNDLDMFAVCGTSVAMANSPDEVKAAADHLAGDVTAGGAVRVLEAIAAGTFFGARAGRDAKGE